MGKAIGIVGGAGPQAGLHLAKKLVFAYQQLGCVDDRDFPKLILYSYPFSEMLKKESPNVKKELREALQFLERAGCEKTVIACNTLHCFLEEKKALSLVCETKKYIREKEFEKVLVLCTSTSASYKLYPGIYLQSDEQKWLDGYIRSVLTGAYDPKELVLFIRQKQNGVDGVLLGCSELSLALEGISLEKIIDPIEVIVKRLCS